MNSIVFFGAGASFGSNATLPFCPPLGNQLFDELEKIGGAAKDIPDDLKNIFRENFETGIIKGEVVMQCHFKERWLVTLLNLHH